ncbi:cysteine desulfurase NifS [candidate division KSB1 bacterium]|nr:MAG: cysteine desulfurase NifS [candidate division KSB1 bacterium]
MKTIYMDNAASTKTDPAVVDEMLRYYDENYAVASSQFSHSPGIAAREALDSARSEIADALNVMPEEIIFTSGGTEANNIAIKGAILSAEKNKNHIICSAIEHNSVLHSCQHLEQNGFKVTYLKVDEKGFIDPDQLFDSINDNTLIVSIQHGNQEVGTIQDIKRISKICREKGVLFHTDAVLTFPSYSIDLKDIEADMLSMSAHKFHGPKGIGALFIRKGTPVKKIFHGGYNEFDIRPGTENIPGAVGFAKAVEIAEKYDYDKIRDLQKNLIQGLTSEIEGVELNGPEDLDRRVPGNVNVSFDKIEGESVVLHYDMRGIAVITGSACFSRSLEPSYVMMAMGFSHERAHGSIRYTLSKFNTQEEIDKVIEVSKEIVDSLRKISPMT